MPEADEPSREEIEKQLRKADEALEDAEGALGAGLSETVVVNRLYYACFHAAQATLYDRGHDPESHRGVLSLFGSEIVVDGPAPREQGRFLNRLSDLRRQADYGYESIEADVDDLFSTTRTFVSDMRSIAADE